MAAALWLSTATLLVACDQDVSTPRLDGPDTTVPYPIDAGGVAGAPATYKQLPLALTDTGDPTVTPVDGVVGVACVGMSNAFLECAALIDGLSGAWGSEVDPQVRVFNCGSGGNAIERWNDPAFDADLWDACVGWRAASAGVRPDQIRVVLHKAADQFTTDGSGAVLPPYPDPASDYFRFRDNLSTFAERVATEIPTAQAVYTTSRSYGGFSGGDALGEPISYEEGHALNAWLADSPSVGGVWHGWGGYIWAPDCSGGVTNGSGICFLRSDYSADGLHPSAAGSEKIARVMHERLLEEAWYRR